MRAPSEANVVKPANPAWVRASHPPITAPGVQRGNELYEAPGKEFVSHNASEGVEPRNYSLSHPGQGFHMPEANIDICEIRRASIDEPGSESVAGKRTDCIGTWENRSAPKGSGQGAETVTRPYGILVVGLTHSRGVNRVMPVEFRSLRHSKGSALMCKGETGYWPGTELEETMNVPQRLLSETSTRHITLPYVAVKVSINEEPDEGNLQVRFSEGHAFPCTKYNETQNLLN